MSNPLAGLPTCDNGRCAQLVSALAEVKARHDRQVVESGGTMGKRLLEVYRRACDRADLAPDVAHHLDAAMLAEIGALLDGSQHG